MNRALGWERQKQEIWVLGLACNLEHSYPPFVHGQIELDQWLQCPINRITCRITTVK